MPKERVISSILIPRFRPGSGQVRDYRRRQRSFGPGTGYRRPTQNRAEIPQPTGVVQYLLSLEPEVTQSRLARSRDADINHGGRVPRPSPQRASIPSACCESASVCARYTTGVDWRPSRREGAIPDLDWIVSCLRGLHWDGVERLESDDYRHTSADADDLLVDQDHCRDFPTRGRG
jgi:hypothetical protein